MRLVACRDHPYHAMHLKGGFFLTRGLGFFPFEGEILGGQPIVAFLSFRLLSASPNESRSVRMHGCVFMVPRWSETYSLPWGDLENTVFIHYAESCFKLKCHVAFSPLISTLHCI